MTLNLLDSEHVHKLSNQMSQFNESYLTFRSGSTTSCDQQDLAFRTFLIVLAKYKENQFYYSATSFRTS